MLTQSIDITDSKQKVSLRVLILIDIPRSTLWYEAILKINKHFSKCPETNLICTWQKKNPHFFYREDCYKVSLIIKWKIRGKFRVKIWWFYQEENVLLLFMLYFDLKKTKPHPQLVNILIIKQGFFLILHYNNQFIVRC